MSGTIPIEYVKFAILDRPLCVWLPDLAETNRRFIRNIDPWFFSYQAELHTAMLANAEVDSASRSHYPALALRLTYGMALEAFFATLGAVIQAPDCVFGWLSNYRNDELRMFVERLSKGEFVRALPPFHPVSWERILENLLAPLKDAHPERFDKLVRLFTKAWTNFAADFLSEASSLEYNSLKHSFRVEPTALKIEIGLNGADTEPLITSTSPLAHTFPHLVRMTGARRHHYDVARTAVALNPSAHAASLHLLACSMHNIIAFARHRVMESSDTIEVRFPDNDDVFEALSTRAGSIPRITYGGGVSVAPHEYWSAEEILSVYPKAEEET